MECTHNDNLFNIHDIERHIIVCLRDIICNTSSDLFCSVGVPLTWIRYRPVAQKVNTISQKNRP